MTSSSRPARSSIVVSWRGRKKATPRRRRSSRSGTTAASSTRRTHGQLMTASTTSRPPAASSTPVGPSQSTRIDAVTAPAASAAVTNDSRRARTWPRAAVGTVRCRRLFPATSRIALPAPLATKKAIVGRTSGTSAGAARPIPCRAIAPLNAAASRGWPTRATDRTLPSTMPRPTAELSTPTPGVVQQQQLQRGRRNENGQHAPDEALADGHRHDRARGGELREGRQAGEAGTLPSDVVSGCPRRRAGGSSLPARRRTARTRGGTSPRRSLPRGSPPRPPVRGGSRRSSRW